MCRIGCNLAVDIQFATLLAVIATAKCVAVALNATSKSVAVAVKATAKSVGVAVNATAKCVEESVKCRSCYKCYSQNCHSRLC